MNDQLIQRLIEIQRFHGWSDEIMAKKLRLSRVYWLRIRTGQRKAGKKIVVGTIDAFPELSEEAIEYLRRM